MNPSCAILAQAAAIPEGDMRGGEEENTGDSWEERIERKKRCGGEGGEKGVGGEERAERRGWKRSGDGEGHRRSACVDYTMWTLYGKNPLWLGGDMLTLPRDLTSPYL